MIDEVQVDELIFAWALDTERELKGKDVAICHQYLKTMVYVKYEDWNQRRDVLCWENGMVELATGKLLPWSPIYLCTYKFHAKYVDPEQETPYIDQVRKIYPDQFWMFERFIQAVFHYDLGNEMALMLNGPTNSGKGTVLNLAYLLFKDVSVAMGLWQLGDKAYGYYGLLNKRLMVDKDSRFKSIDQHTLEVFLKIVGLDTKDGQFINGKYMRQFQTAIEVFIILATNQFAMLPLGTDLLAWFRRCCILKFDQILPSNPAFKEQIINDLDVWASQLINIPYHRWKTPSFEIEKWAKTQAAIWDYSANPYKRYITEMFERSPNHSDFLEQDDVLDWIRQRLLDDTYAVPNDLYLKQLVTSEMAGIKVRKKQKKYTYFYFPVRVRKQWKDYCDGDSTALDAIMGGG